MVSNSTSQQRPGSLGTECWEAPVFCSDAKIPCSFPTTGRGGVLLWPPPGFPWEVTNTPQLLVLPGKPHSHDRRGLWVYKGSCRGFFVARWCLGVLSHDPPLPVASAPSVTCPQGRMATMAPGTPSTAAPPCLLCKGARWPSGAEVGANDAGGTSSAAVAAPCLCSLSAGKAGNSCSRDPPGIQAPVSPEGRARGRGGSVSGRARPQVLWGPSRNTARGARSSELLFFNL